MILKNYNSLFSLNISQKREKLNIISSFDYNIKNGTASHYSRNQRNIGVHGLVIHTLFNDNNNDSVLENITIIRI
jgi:hypothetical protein